MTNLRDEKIKSCGVAVLLGGLGVALGSLVAPRVMTAQGPIDCNNGECISATLCQYVDGVDCSFSEDACITLGC